MLPADIQAWNTISPKLPISVLWIAAQLWEPLAVEHFVSKFKVQSESQRPLRAAASALHMHELGQKDDGVAMAHLSLLGEQGMCRVFGVLALGLRLGLLKPAPSLKRARGDRVPKSSRAGDTVCLGKLSKMFVVTRGETPQLTELVQHARSFTWPVVSGSARFEARNALTAAMSLHDEVKRLHERLGGWAIVGAGYVSQHIQRKLHLLLPGRVPACRCLETTAGWPKTDESLKFWRTLSPDVNGYLSPSVLPSFLHNNKLWSVIGGLSEDPRYTHMWLCLFGNAIGQVPGARAWLTLADTSPATRAGAAAAFEDARARLDRVLGVPPHPRQVLEEVVSLEVPMREKTPGSHA